MRQLKTSPKKLEEFKSRFIYFNHYQVLKDFENINWDLIPQEYHHFLIKDSPNDTLSFYNDYCWFYLFQLEKNKTHSIILSTFNHLTDQKKDIIRNRIQSNHNFIDKLTDRNYATHSIDLVRNQGGRVTQSLLHTFGSAYENTELLFVLYWYCQSLVRQPLINNFEKYENRYGNLSKGRIITDIIKIIGKDLKFNQFKELIRTAYNKNVRHLSFHNSARLDDASEKIIGIDNPKIQISYSAFFESMYSLQQLQDYLKFLVNALQLNEKEIINEGIISVITIKNIETESQVLYLMQLNPFLKQDIVSDKKIKCLSISLRCDKYLFYVEGREVLDLARNTELDSWYEDSKEKSISVLSISPDVFEEDEEMELIEIPDYGSFIITDLYEIEEIKILN